MNSNTYFRAQAYNNAMSNHRLLTACAQLNDNELAQERVSFFPSIIHTWNHILTVDWYYVSALEGSSMGPAAFDPEIPYPLFVDFEVAQRAVDRRLISLCEDLTNAQLAQTVSMIRPKRVQQERADRTLLHLFLHQIHHRGQIHAMLSGTRVPPPQLDEFFLGDEVEQGFRQADFEALAFVESEIWRDL